MFSVNKEFAAAQALSIVVRGGLRECYGGRRRGDLLFPAPDHQTKQQGSGNAGTKPTL